MFTGIIEEIGSIERISQAGTAPLRIHCRSVLGGTRVGDSIAVNGVCLTVIHLFVDAFMADLQPVTRRLSNLGGLRIGDAVNLERSVAAGDRLGGHYVQLIRLALPPDLLRYVVERGFIAVDGASLTVMRLRPDGAEVSLVDHTQQSITLPQKRPGDQVNVEVDVLAKYVERLLGQSPADDISMDVLRRNGFA
jgi:riboflavin synthase